ncbi:MAG TPA: SRPBCC family protein [Bacteroidia bacterium]|nr:SRPBCC family protein [Bacteroidia bacterium]HNT80619.1 SRPBCC family protein [Bacteroidia bacterium]
MSNTVRLHRVLKADIKKVYKAFSNADAMQSWIAPFGFICRVHAMDFKVGGMYKMSFINFGTGFEHSFGGTYLEIVAEKMLKYTDEFDDPNLPGQMITTVEMNAVSGGTELHITQEGIPELIPLDMCYLGWQESLEKLKSLVEPVIPDMG